MAKKADESRGGKARLVVSARCCTTIHDRGFAAGAWMNSRSRMPPFSCVQAAHNPLAMTSIVVPIAAADPAELILMSEAARDQGADVVELRLDTCAEMADGLLDLTVFIADLPRLALPAMVTLRHVDEGGSWAGAADERERLYSLADAAGAKYIDMELAHDRGWRPEHAQLVLSFHDFSGMGGDLQSTITSMHAAGAAIAKVAVTPDDAADLAAIERLYRYATGPVCAIAMGEVGLPSRLLAGCWGAAFTFARLDDAEGSAPGQPTVRELAELYRVKAQGHDTRIFGVIGNPIRHSLSPLIHNTALAAQGINAVYVPFLVRDALAFWQACGRFIDGLSITIPHKHDLLPVMDRCDPLVQRIGAMNTIWRDEAGHAIGTNTDAVAAIACIESQLGTLAGRRAVLLGAGGVARAIAFALADRGVAVTIVNRSSERAVALAQEMGGTVVDLDQAIHLPWDVLINGTSVGMEAPTESPWPAEAHHAQRVVFDTVYTPLETRLLRDALACEARTVGGLDMFIRQAAEQYARFTQQEAPVDIMHRVALEQLQLRARKATGGGATEVYRVR